jgi:hypothetical protein
MTVLLFVFFGCKGIDKEVIISKSTIQKMIEKKFPIERESPLAQIKLFSPQVFFDNDSIGINIQFSVVLLVKNLDGSVSFKCKPVYRPENTSFYMSNFELTYITMNNVNSFTGKDRLMGIISTIVNSLFIDIPIYRLNPSDYKQNLGKMLLKDVSVRGDSLVLLLSL